MAKGINVWVAAVAVLGLLATVAAAALLTGLVAEPQSAALSAATASGTAWTWAARWGLHLLRLAAGWM